MVMAYMWQRAESFRAPQGTHFKLDFILQEYNGGLLSFLFESDRVRRSRRSWSVRQLQRYATQATLEHERQTIADFSERRMRKLLRARHYRSRLKADRHVQDVQGLMRVLAAAGSPHELTYCKEIASSTGHLYWQGARSAAVRRVAELGGAAEVPFLMGLLNNSHIEAATHADIISALGIIGPAAASPDLIDRIFKFMADTPAAYEYQISWAAQALLALQAIDDPRLVPYLKRLNPWAIFALRLNAKKISGKSLLESMISAGLVQSGLGDAAERDLVKRLEKGINIGDMYFPTHHALERGIGVFMFETKDYDQGGYLAWLDDLADYSKPHIEVSNPQYSNGLLTCVCASLPVRVDELDKDRVDPTPILVALNASLVESGHLHRYYFLDSGGEDFHVLAASEVVTNGLIEELGFPCELIANGI